MHNDDHQWLASGETREAKLKKQQVRGLLKQGLTRREVLQYGGLAGTSLSTLWALASQPAAAATTPTTTPPKRGGTLTIAIEAFGQESFLIHKSATFTPGQQAPLYDYVLYFDPNDPFVLKPGLAESWSTKDMKEWTFKIRKGVPWDRGQGEVTAEDVAFTLKLLSRDDAKSPDTPYWRARIGKMKVVDRYTLAFNFDRIDSDLAFQLSSWRRSPIMCKKYIETVGEDAADRAPVGSGPYRLSKYVPGSQVELEAIGPSHWRVIPKWDRIIFLNMPEDTTRLAMLDTGRADMALITPEQLKDAEKRGYAIFPSDVRGMFSVMFGGLFTPGHPEYQGKDPWQNIKVREAMNIAIDRQAINKMFFGNLGTSEPLQGNNIAPPGTVEKYPIPYEPERAKRLLREAGQEKGLTPQLMSFVYPGIPQTPQIMEAIAGYWEVIGIKAKITPIDQVSFREYWIKDKTNGMLWPWNNPITPAFQARFEKFFYSKDIGFNIYTDAHLDGVFGELIRTGEPRRREKMLADAQVYLREKWAAIHILNVPMRMYAGNRSKVGSWKPGPSAEWNPWEYIAPR